MDNRPISELERANAVYEEDILLISQKENDQYISRKIGAGVFKGDSAYDLAVKEGFTGNLGEWLSSIKGWQPITSGEFLDLLDAQLDKSKLYASLNERINNSTSELRVEIKKQLEDINNLQNQVIAEADKRIQDIENLNRDLIVEAERRIQDIKIVQESVTLETEDRLRQASDLANQILLEKESRTDDIVNLIEKLNDEQNDRVLAIRQVEDLLSSEIEARRSLLKEAVDKINQETSDRIKDIDTIRNSITTNQIEQVEKIENILESIDSLDYQIGSNHTFLLSNYSTTKTATEETARQIEALRTNYLDPILEQKASATALEQVVVDLGKVDDTLKANISKIDGIFAELTPLMAGDETDLIGDESKYVGVWTEQSARLEGDFALGQRVDNVVSTYTDNKTTTDARIAREEKARADGDSALASIVTSLTTRVGNSEGALVTLEQVNTDLDSSLSEISSKLDNTIQEVSTKASSSALSDLASNVEVLEGSISSTTNSITALENSLETTNTNLNKKADSTAVNELSSKVTAIDETVNSNSSNIIALTNSLGSKNKTYYQPSVPTENISVGDIWVNSSPSKNNELKRYNGLYWDVISDPRVSSNSSAISALESKTTQHDEELTSQSSLITDLKADLDVSKQDLLLKADSSALNDLSNTVSNIGGNISSVSGDVTELKNNLESLEANVQTKASATALEDLSTKVERTANNVVSQGQDITNLNNSLVTVTTNINSKGRVIYSENEPSEAERLAQNLWIDTKDNNNTPKRWDGVEWVVVTDKVAAEALAKADANSQVLTTKADSSAVSSLTNKVEAVEETVTSQSTNLVALANSLEETSQEVANKGKVIFSNTEPAEDERALPNLWIDTSNNKNTPKRWTGSSWASVTDKVALDALTASQAIADLLPTKADASAVSSLDSKVSNLEGNITSQSQDITTLTNSLSTTNESVSGKGKVIYSDSTPVEGDRLPQNLWIDTTGGGNTPKRWNGQFWLAITDKTALDALAAANQVKEDLATKVDSSAFNSLTSKVNSAENSLSSQGQAITNLSNNLETTSKIADEALLASQTTAQEVKTKASSEALENLSSAVGEIDGKVYSTAQNVDRLSGTVETLSENLATKADASVLTDYSTKVDTTEAISNANTTLTSSLNLFKTETDAKLDDQLLISKVSNSGNLLYSDVTFSKGFNSVSSYDNNSTGKVLVERIYRETDNPTKSSHQLKITLDGNATPGFGGFVQTLHSRANAIFVVKYLMKVPTTYYVATASNSLGNGASDKIIGLSSGTGKYETYVRVIKCGANGDFSSSGYVYFYGDTDPKNSIDHVMLASIEAWDATDFVRSATSDEVASINASLINDYYTKTTTDEAIANSLTSFQTSYVDKELNKKASANTVEQITNEIHNSETGLNATAEKLSGVYAQVNPEFIGADTGFIGADSGSVSVWSEYSARIEGDLALSSRIDNVSANLEGNLASVQTQTKATSDKVSSLASQVTVLSSAVEGNISLVMDQYYTKVQTGQVVAQSIIDLKANYISPELNLKASSQALQETQTQVTEIDGKLKTTSQRTEGVYAQVNPDLIGDSSGSIGDESQNVGSWSQYSALIEGDFATSQKIDNISVRVANNTASINQTNTVVIDKFRSVAESLNKVESKFNENLSSVNSVIGVWTDKDKTLAKYVTDLNSLVGSNQAEITKNYLTTVDTKNAITEGIDRFKTEYLSDELKKKASAEVLDQVKAAIENTENGLVATADKLDGVFLKVNPKLIGSDEDFIGKTSSSVGVWTEYSARIEEDFALGNRIDNLHVNLGKNASSIQEVNEVLTDKTQALANSITKMDSKFENSLGSINTKLGTWTSSESSISDYIMNINSVVGKNSSSIQVQGTSIDGLSSQYTVKIDTNGRVSGFGLASNPNNQASSEFAVVADKFYIASPEENGKGKSPFYVLTKDQNTGGEISEAGVYLNQAFIRKASIDSVHIKDAAISDAKIFNLDAAKLTTGFISAERLSTGIISTDHLQVGAVTEAKFSPGVLNNYLTSNQFVSDSLSDNVLTASEKTSIKNNWEQIKNNLKFYLESAKIFDITLATPAYTDLSAYILTLNLDDTNSTQIDSELFKAKFNAWYAEEYAIRSAIDTKVKDLNKNSLNQATSATDLLTRWKANKNNTLYIDDNRIAVNMIAAENIAADSITADKIKFGGVSSQNLADDIKSDINKGMTANSKVNELIANLDDDNVLTSVEKTFLYSKWQEVEKTGAWIAWQCFNIFGTNLDKETTYDPYFNLFKNFINENVSKDGLNKSTNISTITITVDGSTYGGSEAMRRMMVAYYEAENKMLSKIQELQYKYTLGVDTKVSLAASVLDKLADDNIITKQEKPALKLQYTNIVNDFDDLALAASNQGISSSVFAAAYNDLVNVFNLIFQDMASDTNWPGDDLRAKMRAYSDQRGYLIQRLSNDAKDKANEASAKALEALQALTKMADDNVITIYEKPALSFSWQNIINDFDDLETAGKNQQVDTADFKTAYTSLKTAVDLILANPSVNTEWSGQDLRDRMKSYADQRGSLLQRLANDAKDKANAAMAAITNAISDSVLTPSEKQQFKIKWVEEYQDLDKLKLKAQTSGVDTSSSNYNNYLICFNYINDNFTPIWNTADNSSINPTDWKTRFEDLRKYKTLLENEISAKIKDIASSALNATQQLNQTVANKADSSALLSLDHDVKVIDGKVQAYGESITSLSADLSTKVGKGDVNSIISETQNGKKHIISTEGLDNNLYYPVTIAVNGLFSKISMLINLGEAQASWATHGIGWSCGLTVTQRASGWGSNSIDLTIEKFDYAWTNQSPVINVGQLGTMSSALFYVRGGSKYHFYVDSNCYDPQLWTEKKIFNEEYNIYVEPINYSSGLEPKSLKQNVQANAVATSTLKANVDEINGKVVAQSSSILNLQTNVDTISRDLTTKANSSVLAQYYTRDEADRATAGKIENFNSSFEIGGRNYFRKTTPLNPHQLQEVRRDLPDTPNGFYVVGSQTPSNNLRLPGVITGNGKWTISGWVRGSQNTAISFFIDICDKELSKQIVINKDGTNSWEKFTYTVTVDNYSADTYNFVDISNLSWAYFYFKDIKIEKGSKATDWTPAPEDIDQKLTSIDASISTLQNTTANNTQSIATTQNQLKARFDALSVGGRNLWLNSKVKFDGNDGASTVNITENYIEVTPVYNGGYIYVWLTGDNAGEYTLSVDAEAPSVELGLGIGYTETGGSRSWVVTGKKRCFITMTRKDGERGLLIIRVYNAPSVKLSNFKLEKGNVATDWTPAPEDIDQKFTETDANIKNTYITKSDATQAISSAKTELNSSYNKSLMDSRADGVNLINFSKMVPGYFSADGSIGQSATDHMDMNYYSCIGGESFTCHMSAVIGSVGGIGRVLWYDSNKNLISSSDCNWNGTYTPYTFKSPVNARFYRYSMIGKYPVARIKLERGTISTGFSFSDLDESFYRVLLIQALSGNQLSSNPDFRDNHSGVSSYDNTGTRRVTLDRVPKDPDNPSNSSHQLNCTISAGASPGYGGFVFSVISKYNGLFAIRIVMKVPVGYIINIASNALPEGTDYRIIGSNEGTGKYETYTILCKCGVTGTQSNFGYVYFTDKSAVKLSGTQTDIVKISKLEAFDATSDKPMVSKANLDEYKQTVANQYGAISENVKTISTKVGDNEAAIKVQAQSINGINAQYTIKTDVNGKVAGIGLVNSGKSSEFAVTADTFRVSNGSTDIAPFTISNNEILFNGKVSFKNVTSAGNLVSNFSKTNSGTGWKNYTGIQSYTSFDGTNTPCMEIHTQGSIEVVSDKFKVDPSKSYEFSVWLYSSGGNTTGRDYMGMFTYDSGGGVIISTAFDVNNPNSNWDEGNPYFWHKGHGENYRDKWVKYTGYVLAAGTDLSSIKGALGQNIDRCFRLKSNTDSMLFRILNYYNDGTTVNKLYMVHPSVKEVDTNSLIETVNNKKATSNLYYPGTTQIDGGKIQTGSITADRIQIGSLGRDRLDNTFTQSIDATKSKIDNLSVGGRNFFLNSKVMSGGHDGSAIFTVTSDYIEIKNLRVGGYIYIWLPANTGISDNEDISYSVDCETADNPIFFSNLYNANTIPSTQTINGKKRIKCSGRGVNGLFFVRNYGPIDATMRLSNFKMERGNLVTDWTPAPEDVNAAIESKSKTFVTTPTVPYSTGDLWKDGNTVKVCTTARLTGAYTASDWVLAGDVTSNNTSADTAKVNGISAATVTANASKGAAVYDDVMSDLKITPVEKTAISQEWSRIQKEYASLVAQATALSVSTTSLTSAYNGLSTTDPAMSTILASMSTTTLTAAQRDAYKVQYTTYYTQAVNMVKTINEKIASNAKADLANLKIGGNNLVIPGYDSYTSSLTGFLVCIPQPYDIKDDITYTLSFIVKGAESVTTMGIGFAANYKADSFGDFWNPDNSEGKKVWTGKLSSRYSKSFFYIWINSPCTVRDIQLEEGDKATSYQKNSDYRDMRPFISDMPNDKLQNKWAYIAYKKPQLSANEMMHYGYLEGDIVSQGYVNVGNTMFSDTKFDNTYIIFRTIVTPNSVVNSGLFNFIGDDAHSIYVNGQMLYSSTLYKGGGNIPFKLFSGANNVIDILVSNGGGGAGFSTTTSLQDLGKMCAPSLTAVELETNSKLINDILSDNVITTDEKQSLLITYKQIASEFDTWRGEAEALGINVSEQISATNKLLSNSRPYLGWICRNDSISSSDTLNDGERTTLMNALSDYYVSNKTITKLVTEKLRESKTKADKVTTAIKNSSNWDGVSGSLVLSRNNISGGKDLANLWTNQLFDPAFPSILDSTNEGKLKESQGSNLIRLNARHCIGDWSTRFYVKPGEQYIISCIGFNYSDVRFYTGLWITDDNGGGSTYPGYHGFVPLVEVGSTGGGWKFYEAIFTVPEGYDPSTILAARAHFFQDTYDFSVVHCKISNLVIKKVIKESAIDPNLVNRSIQAKNAVDDIISDNKITPDEKQTLLVTYKQISNDNDIWRNQAYLIGLDYTRQWNAQATLLSTNRPYLGWVCRSDALNQTDTLNAGERTTLMNAIAEYHAANQDLAKRVGSNLRTTANTASGVATSARDLLNRWKANGNGTLYIDDNSIAVNKIGANEIAAGAITADKLYVGDVTNYWGNQYFDPNIKPYFGTNAGGCAKGLAVAIYDTNDYYDFNCLFPITKGDSFRFELTAYRDSGVGEISIGFHLYDVNKNWNGQVNSSITWYTDPGSGWGRYYATVTIPDSGSYAYAMPRINSTAAGQWRIGDLVINKRATGTLIVDGSITGDKIKANTSITAPTINGGNINIGNGNFVVDQWGNLTANSGTFKGTVLAENISGKIDVKSLKKSAIMNGYRMYFAMGQVPSGTTFQKDFTAFMADIVFYNKKYEWLSADYVSKGAISYYYGTNGADVGAICFSLTVECVKSKTVTQKVLTVDDYVDLVIESLSGVEIYKQLNIGFGRVSKEVSFTLVPGIYIINYVLRNTGWGPCSVNIVGDIVDNDSIFFA